MAFAARGLECLVQCCSPPRGLDSGLLRSSKGQNASGQPRLSMSLMSVCHIAVISECPPAWQFPPKSETSASSYSLAALDARCLTQPRLGVGARGVIAPARRRYFSEYQLTATSEPHLFGGRFLLTDLPIGATERLPRVPRLPCRPVRQSLVCLSLNATKALQDRFSLGVLLRGSRAVSRN